MASSSAHKMQLTLPSDTEIRMVRSFDAPPHLVFTAWTKPEHVRRWWGCDGSMMTVCEIDLRPGGAWRFVVEMPDGSRNPFKGVFQKIVPGRELVKTLIYDVEPYNAEVAVETILFEAVAGGGTRTISTVKHTCREARDGHLSSGMEIGAAQALDRLENLLAELG